VEAPLSRILVVEDYEPVRRFICSMLRERPGFQIVEEVTDGLEAIQKAGELQPDLIMLDIGLPSLNGIEAARRLRKLFPKIKILFVSQESSAVVVQEALALGALGYVVKAYAGSELLAAVEAVLQGRQFVSSGLSGHYFTPALDSKIIDRPNEPLPALALGRMEITGSHEVEFYSDDAAFLLGVTGFIEAALEAGRPVIVVATESHRTRLLETLLARGVDGSAAIEQGLYPPLDVNKALSTFMVNALADSVRYLKFLGDLVSSPARAANAKHARVAVFSEIAPTLWVRGNADAAIQVERATDELAKTRNVDILCGYVLNSFQREQYHIYKRIYAAHTAGCSQ
jgi:DNA-binding NarL/FixJ family response regulator